MHPALVSMTRLATVCQPQHLLLSGGKKRAESALQSPDELRCLCQEAYERISQLERQLFSLTGK